MIDYSIDHNTRVVKELANCNIQEHIHDSQDTKEKVIYNPADSVWDSRCLGVIRSWIFPVLLI